MSRIKVVNIIGGFNDGGAQRVVYDNALTLKDDDTLDYSICVLCKNENSNLSKMCVENGINITYLNFEPLQGTGLFNNIKNWILMNNLVFNYLKKEHPDVIHTHITSIFKYVNIAFFACKAKRVHTFHSDPYAIDSLSRLIATVILHLLNFIGTCVSEDQEEKVRQVYRLKKTHVIHNGINFTRLNKTYDRKKLRACFGISDNTTVFGFVGRLVAVKNIPYIIDVFDAYTKYSPDSILLLCGDGPLRNELEEYANSSKSREHIRFLGNVKNVSEVYSVMDYFLLMSHYESSSIATLEAQYYSIPCYISNAIPMATIYSDKVKRIDIKEMSATATAEHIFFNKGFDKQITTIDDYDLNSCVRKLVHIYVDK